MLSRFGITFLLSSKHLLTSWLDSPSAVILEPPKITSVTVSIVSPSLCHEVMGLDAMNFVFWMLSFKPAFSLSSSMFIKRLFSSSLISAIKVVSSTYLRLLIFLPAVVIPTCTSSSLAFRILNLAWNVPLVALIFLKRSLVFHTLLFPSISLHWGRLSYLSFLFFGMLHSDGYVSPLLLCVSLLFSICKASSGNHFAFLHFFALGMVLITTSCTMSRSSVYGSSVTLFNRSNPLNLFVMSTV